MERIESAVSDLACWGTAAVIVIGLLALAMKLKEVQVDESAGYSYASVRQSVRRVQTDGRRGRILDRRGVVLADNRQAYSIVCDAAFFQRKTWKETSEAIARGLTNVARVIGAECPLRERTISRHVKQSLAMPLIAWRDVDHVQLARFLEHGREIPGFSCLETAERVYPQKMLAAHVIGYVGRDRGLEEAGDEKFNYFQPEMRGRAGLEIYYDSFLRGVSGEDKVLVDARGFAIRQWTVLPAQAGPDLKLTLDIDLQRAVEEQLKGLRGACAVIDPRNGEVLALASAPTYDPNAFVPVLSPELYARYVSDPLKPLLNRVSGGAYAPGSTFKPVVALAALSSGVSAGLTCDCSGLFTFGTMHLHCASRWGHGTIDMRHALMKSCNPYFCSLGVSIGTNAIIRTAKVFGLGMKTGLDLGVDAAGVVPDAEWKNRTYGERWFGGDLVQMSIGQGMLLTSPLQMARVAGAIGTGILVTPRLKIDLPVERSPLPFTIDQLQVVREGMSLVVNGDGHERGTGRRGGEGVPVRVCGKTGTAEIGQGTTRRKNTWFIAYAPEKNPTVAVAMVIECGESGGGTTAPKVAEVLKAYYHAH